MGINLTKLCSKCNQTKELTEFNKRKASPDGYQPLCRICQNNRDNAKYAQNPKDTIDAVRERTLINKRLLDLIKMEAGCKDCGLKGEPGYIYDFDHLRDKNFIISRMVSHSWASILKEVEKCEIVCGNCHRQRTHFRIWGTLDPVPPKKTYTKAFLSRMWKRLQEFKNCPCQDCNKQFHFSAMECDHRDPSTKKGEPSNLARYGPESLFEEELLKCDVVCSNCHRKRSAKMFGFDFLPVLDIE